MKLSRLLSICSLAVFLVSEIGSASASPVTGLFTFKEPGITTYVASYDAAQEKQDWIVARRNNGADTVFRFGAKVVLQTTPETDVESLLVDHELTLLENPQANVFILLAEDALAAVRAAHDLARLADVLIVHPDMQRPVKRASEYSKFPTDPYFDMQWHLESRSTNGIPAGLDVNARSAWPHASGTNISVAVVDEGVELDHPDLEAAAAGQPHFNWISGVPIGDPIVTSAGHGTAVAGLAAARGMNGIGVSGVAGHSAITSWIVFGINTVASSTQMMQMFQAHSNAVQVQNHSWSYSNFQQLAPAPIENVGISNAVTFGREGKGVVMVRSAGNDRELLVNANDDGYVNNPQIIGVAAVRTDGQFASYSNPGACLLVSGPSGDTQFNFDGLLTTDLTGSAGYNSSNTVGDTNNYAQFSGTSAAAPVVAGIVALMLEANPELSYRDVQQILVQSSRQWDLSDPLLRPNQAGRLVGINTGFGVPDAGMAVRLAEQWPPTRPLTVLRFENNLTNQIPNLGFRIETFGNNIPLQIASIPATPSLGIHAEDLTPFYPLVDVGYATNTISEDLNGKAAFIQRGGATFREKITNAADAGANLAVIANYPEDDQRIIMADTFRSEIPAMFIVGSDGAALQNYMQTNGITQVRSILFSAQHTNHVTTPMLVEHVQVRIHTDHPRRGDLRVTVTSPAGTRSVLQNIGDDFNGGPFDWTYMSTHHFNESSQGVWTIQVSDENNPPFGRLLFSELTLYGTEIVDADRDGLDDNWEVTHFGHLANKPEDDANGDGESNMMEFLKDTDPLEPVAPPEISISEWRPGWMRLGWISNPNTSYEVFENPLVDQPMMSVTNIAGRLGATDWMTVSTNAPSGFYLLRSAPAGSTP